MKLSDFAGQLKAENSFIKASFGGFAGSGKTRTMTEFAIGCYRALGCTKPMLIIDNERGSRFLIPILKRAGIETYLKETVELSDVLQAFKLYKEGAIDFLFIDSLTKVWYKYVRDYKEKNRKAFMTLQDWGKILPAWQETFADAYVDLQGNCVFTGRGGYTYDAEENEETKKVEFVKSGVKMKMAGETPFEPDLNIWMDIVQELDDNGKPILYRDALVMKDRSGLIDGKTFRNPVFNDFKPVIDFLMSNDIGEVKKADKAVNLAPHEIYDDKRAQKEIIFEKIKAEFDKREFGTSTKDKSLKMLIYEKAFGTTSMTEMERFTVDKLDRCLSRVIELLTSYDSAANKEEAIKSFEFSLFNQF